MSNKTATSAASTGGAKPRGGFHARVGARSVATGATFGTFAQAPAEIPASNAACTACHTAEGEAAEDQACLGSLHATLTCETCHDDAKELDELHAKTKAKRMPMRLKKTTVEDETCIACHEATGEEFAKLSGGSLLADANGLEVNAHAVITGEQPEGIACVSCHEVHDDTLPAEQAQKVCKSCHHAQVFECFTCHDHS